MQQYKYSHACVSCKIEDFVETHFIHHAEQAAEAAAVVLVYSAVSTSVAVYQVEYRLAA